MKRTLRARYGRVFAMDVALAASLALSLAGWSTHAVAGWVVDPTKINPTLCAQDKKLAISITNQIAALESRRSSPEFAGPKSTLYTQQMRALQTEATANAAAEKTACTGYVYEGPPVRSGPMVETLGAYMPNGTTGGGAEPSGLTVSLAGDSAVTYAVSLDAGVWKSVNGASWVRLNRSPRYAYAIAVDPNNHSHLAVGERGGDAVDHHNDGAGVWESTDAGATWSYIFNPLTRTGCSSQAISAVLFTKSSALLIATQCGLGRRAQGATSFTFAGKPISGLAVNDITASDSLIWARDDQQLFVSNTDGATWTVHAIPPQFTPVEAGDRFSLAAFDNAAYFPCCQDNRLAKFPCGNLDDLVVFDVATTTFALQNSIVGGKPAMGCSGTGLGGNRFVKAFTTSDPNKGVVHHLFYGAGQDVYEATALNADGTAQAWTHPLGYTHDPVHSDFWDFLLEPDGSAEWISNDGGVYRRALNPAAGWKRYDAGLYTHHIHTLTVVGAPGTYQIAYPTSDNDAWFTANHAWSHENSMGDVNWSVGDMANPNIALLIRRTGACSGQTCGLLTGFGSNVPGGNSLRRAQPSNGSRDGPESFAFIQSLATEAPTKFELDAVMLSDLPLQSADGSGLHNVGGALGANVPVGVGNPVLLRNPDYAANPDVDSAKGKGWSVIANNLPAGASRFWVAGGHASPIVYLMAATSSGPKLYKASQVPLPGSGAPTSWTALNVQGSVLDKTPFPNSGILDGSQAFGPVFVNPYKSSEVYVLTSGGVVVSENGGFSFAPDKTLTALITGQGKYPLTGAFAGGDETGVRKASRAVAMGTLANITFDRADPGAVVAVSPFTGVFYRNEAGLWTDLSSLLPRPMSSPSDGRIVGDNIFVSTEGGGVVHISGFKAAP